MNSGAMKIIWIKAYLSSFLIIEIIESGRGVNKGFFPITTLSFSSRISSQGEFFKGRGTYGGRALTGKNSSPLFLIQRPYKWVICLPELILPSSAQSLFDLFSLPYMGVRRIN